MAQPAMVKVVPTVLSAEGRSTPISAFALTVMRLTATWSNVPEMVLRAYTARSCTPGCSPVIVK